MHLLYTYRYFFCSVVMALTFLRCEVRWHCLLSTYQFNSHYFQKDVIAWGGGVKFFKNLFC